MTDEKLDLRELLRAMTAAMGMELKDLWKETKAFASIQLKAFAENLKLIQRLKLKGSISREQAKYHISLNRSALRVVLLTLKGMSLVAAEQAINSAISAIRDVVNRVIGWKLL